MMQLITTFSLGVLFSPWSYGIFYLLLFIIMYEVVFFYYTGPYNPYWNPEVRGGVILAAILGFIVGRVFAEQDIFIDADPPK